MTVPALHISQRPVKWEKWCGRGETEGEGGRGGKRERDKGRDSAIDESETGGIGSGPDAKPKTEKDLLSGLGSTNGGWLSNRSSPPKKHEKGTTDSRSRRSATSSSAVSERPLPPENGELQEDGLEGEGAPYWEEAGEAI